MSDVPLKLRDVKKRFSDVQPAQSLTGHLLYLTSTLANISDESEISSTLKTVAAQVAQIVEVDSVFIMLKRRGEDFVVDDRHVASFALSLSEEHALGSFLMQQVVTGSINNSKALRLADCRQQFLDSNYYGQRTKLVSLLAVPMMFGNRMMGVLVAARGEIGGFHEADETTLQRVGDFVAEDLERWWQYANLVKDPVTGFYHRQVMMEFLTQEVARSRRYQAPLSAMMIDVDGFTYLKPQHSDANIDQVVRKVAQCILSEVRHTDIGARASDNAFLLVQPMTHIRNASELAVRLRAKFNQFPISVNEMALKISLSVGISSLRDTDDDALHFVARADRALSAAKNFGGNHIVVDDE